MPQESRPGKSDIRTDSYRLRYRVLFDATMVGELPDELCEARNGTDGVTQSCGFPAEVREIPLVVQNISWEEDGEV